MTHTYDETVRKRLFDMEWMTAVKLAVPLVVGALDIESSENQSSNLERWLVELRRTR